ncbi:MAG TPA: fumarylacetoacetate hydrolase family protein [Polyangia bacterium]
MKLHRTRSGLVAVHEGKARALSLAWDDVFRAPDPRSLLLDAIARGVDRADVSDVELLPPIGTQEVWAAGVTYYRSRDARIEESAGGGDFYAKVYAAARPELFFKASPHRVVGPGQPVRIRRDSRWNVPEPELVLAINAAGKIFGYVAGNDMSSRDIEGENPLYLPQAKVYDGSCALGPGIYLPTEPLGPSTAIRLAIARGGTVVFSGETTLAQLKREPAELAAYLFAETSFPAGAYLMTGTGIIPDADFTLQVGDEVRIHIAGIGDLINVVTS